MENKLILGALVDTQLVDLKKFMESDSVIVIQIVRAAEVEDILGREGLQWIEILF